MYKIASQALRELDRNVVDSYSQYASLLEESEFLPNSEAYKKIHQKIDGLRSLAERVNPESEFDGLVLEHITSILDVQEGIAGFFLTDSSDLTTQQLVDLVNGDGTYEFIEEEARKFDWNSVGGPGRISYKRKLLERAKSTTEKLVQTVREDVLKYGKEKGFIPGNFNFELIIDETLESLPLAYWDPQNNRMGVNTTVFDIVEESDLVKVYPGNLHALAFHEVLGHASHHHFSGNLPFTLRPEKREYREGNFASISVEEAIAIGAENKGREYLEEHAERFGLSAEHIKQENQKDEESYQNGIAQIYHSLLKEREEREGIDFLEELSKITGREIAKDNDIPPLMNADDSVFVAGMFGGQKIIDQVLNKLPERFPNVSQREIDQVKRTGLWAWQVYPKFLDYALTEANKTTPQLS